MKMKNAKSIIIIIYFKNVQKMCGQTNKQTHRMITVTCHIKIGPPVFSSGESKFFDPNGPPGTIKCIKNDLIYLDPPDTFRPCI